MFIDEFGFLWFALFFTVPQKCNANYLQKFIARIADANIYFVEFFWAALKSREESMELVVEYFEKSYIN